MADLLSVFISAATISVSVVMIVAGLAKEVWPQQLEVLLYRALPAGIWRDRVLTSRAVVRTIAATEVSIGLGLLILPRDPSRVLALLTPIMFATFVYVVWWAGVRGLSCGCLGKLSAAKASKAELVRSIALLVVSGALAGARLSNPGVHVTLGISSIIGALLILASIALVTAALSSWTTRVIQPPEVVGDPPKRVALLHGEPSRDLTRRQVLRGGAAAAVLAVGGLLLPESVKQALACWTWLQPNFAAYPTYTWYPMWVNYDTSLSDGLWTTIYWGDGTYSSGYASGHRFGAWNYIVSEGTYYPQAYVGGCWDTSTTYIINSATDTCQKRLEHCDQCCWNKGYGDPCGDCCASCFVGCRNGPPCTAGACLGCWVEVL